MDSTVEVEVVPLGLSPVKIAPVDASFTEEPDKKDEDKPPSNQQAPHSFRLKHASDPSKFKPVEVVSETPSKQSPKNAFHTFKKNLDAISRKISLKKPTSTAGGHAASGGFHSSRSLDHEKTAGDLEEEEDAVTTPGPVPSTSQSHVYLHKKLSKGFSAQLTSIFKGAGGTFKKQQRTNNAKLDKAAGPTSDKESDTMPNTSSQDKAPQEGTITFKEPNRYFVEGYKNWKEPVEITQAGMKDGIYITHCENTYFKVPQKVTKIELSRCKRVNLSCTAVISACDIENSDGILIEISQRCPGIAISNTQSLKVYLPREAMSDLEIASSGDGSATILVPDAEDPSDYKEVPVPFQFVHRFKGDKLVSEVSPLYY